MYSKKNPMIVSTIMLLGYYSSSMENYSRPDRLTSTIRIPTKNAFLRYTMKISTVMMTLVALSFIVCGLMCIKIGVVSFSEYAAENASYYQTGCNVIKCETYGWYDQSNLLAVQSYYPYIHSGLFSTSTVCESYHAEVQVSCYVSPHKLLLNLPHNNVKNIFTVMLGIVCILMGALLASTLTTPYFG